MKNILAISASALALAVSAPALAQNVSDVDQLGNSNDATVNQTGSNTSDIDQDGDGNIAANTQSGSGNSSTIDQDAFPFAMLI